MKVYEEWEVWLIIIIKIFVLIVGMRDFLVVIEIWLNLSFRVEESILIF